MGIVAAAKCTMGDHYPTASFTETPLSAVDDHPHLVFSAGDDHPHHVPSAGDDHPHLVISASDDHLATEQPSPRGSCPLP